MSNPKTVTQLFNRFSWQIFFLMTVMIFIGSGTSLFWEYKTILLNDRKNLKQFGSEIREQILRRQDLQVLEKCLRLFNEERIVSIIISTGGSKICNDEKGKPYFKYTIHENIYFDSEEKAAAADINVVYSSDFLVEAGRNIFVFYSILLFILVYLSKRFLNDINLEVINPLKELSSKFTESTSEMPRISPSGYDISEIRQLAESFIDMVRRIESFQEKEIAQKQIESFSMLARQVSHDIRSPLSALTMVVGTLKEIPEDRRVLIRNATQRINDIANDLLQKSQKSNLENPDYSTLGTNDKYISDSISQLSTAFLPALIDILISEKRMQYREFTELEIETDFKNSYGAFVDINSNELKRVISNLVNNAVEAFDKSGGKITVGIRNKIPVEGEDKESKVEIFIKDNGKGIPKRILEKLGQVGVTEGKVGTESGSGLGVYHAKKTAESFGGHIFIDSIENRGSIVRIFLPLAKAPIWFANKIDLTGKKFLVSLDDDISIHQIWIGRLQSLGLNDIEHIKFQSGEAFESYVRTNLNTLKQTLFLVDFELLNQIKTGLDIIEELALEKYSILVTSRYEEASIQARASNLKLTLLPKSLAGFVPIERELSKESYDCVLINDDDLLNRSNLKSSNSDDVSKGKIKYDLCLIDDDTELIHTIWGSVAKDKGLNIRMFATPEEFLIVANEIDRLTPVYIDVSLGNGIKGTDFAQEVHKLGFTEINLATGYDSDSIVAPSFISRIVGKDFPNLENPLNRS